MAKRRVPSTSNYLARNRYRKDIKKIGRVARAAAKGDLKRARHLQVEARKLLREIERERKRDVRANRRLLRQLLNRRYRRMSAVERLLGLYRPKSTRLTTSRKKSIEKVWSRAEKILSRSTKSKKRRKGGRAKPLHPHPIKRRTRSISELNRKKLQIALKSLRADKGLSEAARDAQLPRKTLSRLLEQTGVAEKRGRKWVVRDDVPRQMLLYSNGDAIVVTVPDLRSAKIVGAFMSHVGEFLNSNEPAFLTLFEGQGIADVEGVWHPFETDPEALYRLAHTGSETFEQVYAIGSDL